MHSEAPQVAAPADAPNALELGQVIGDRYVVEEHISSGGFGAVYRASDKEISSHQVALKLLHTPAADADARASAMRELKLIASVSHPSVVQFKDYGWHEGRLWFAMPWFRGETLDQRFPYGMTRAEARPIFERLAMGLAAMHEVGIEHHDIKPENIFLADIAGFDGGLPVLLDLGIAGEQGEGPRGLTLDYAAPETARQALGDETGVTAAADVFSLALVLRNVLEPPDIPEGEFSALALLHQRATEPIAPLQQRSLRYLRAPMQRWLHEDPAERPSATELADELAVLTAPEERRAARARLLKRLLPVIAIAALLVSLLWMQVQEQQTQLTQKQEQLSEQIQQTTALRERSEDQLGKLENQMAEIGSQRLELTRAIGIARELNQQLDTTEKQRAQLSRRARTLTSERDGLRTGLTALEGQYASLQGARDALQNKFERLTAERDGLTRERDALQAQRARLEAESAALDKQLQEGKQRLQSLEIQRDMVQQKLGEAQQEATLLRKERAALERTQGMLQKRIDTLEDDKRSLEKALRDARKAKPPVLQLDPAAAERLAPPAAARELK